MTKICTLCKKEKSLFDFSHDSSTKSGFRSSCKDCIKQYRHEYYLTNTNKEKEYRKQYYNKNKKYCQQLDKEYKLENKNELNQKRRERRKNNPAKYRDYERKHEAENKEKRTQQRRQSRDTNPQKYREYNSNYIRQRKAKDPAFKLICNIRVAINKILIGKIKKGHAIDLLGCSSDFLKQYLETKFMPGMTWLNHGVGNGMWNVDHIIPLRRPEHDFKDQTLLKKLWHYTNLQPLWFEDNRAKSNKLE